jgi:hypothetical protein
MTNSETPYFGKDTTYEQQRKARLQDCIDDYLQDDRVSHLILINDIKDCIDDATKYHTEKLEKANAVLNLIRSDEC